MLCHSQTNLDSKCFQSVKQVYFYCTAKSSQWNLQNIADETNFIFQSGALALTISHHPSVNSPSVKIWSQHKPQTFIPKTERGNQICPTAVEVSSKNWHLFAVRKVLKLMFSDVRKVLKLLATSDLRLLHSLVCEIQFAKELHDMEQIYVFVKCCPVSDCNVIATSHSTMLINFNRNWTISEVEITTRTEYFHIFKAVI